MQLLLQILERCTVFGMILWFVLKFSIKFSRNFSYFFVLYMLKYTSDWCIRSGGTEWYPLISVTLAFCGNKTYLSKRDFCRPSFVNMYLYNSFVKVIINYIAV